MGAPVLYDSSGNILTGYYQWDTNQFITIKGVEPGCTMECHFAKMQGTVAYAVDPTVSGNNFVVAVPNTVFQTPNNFYLFLYVDTPNDGQRTKYEYEIPVKYRLRPQAYEEPTEQERSSMRTLLLKAEGWAKGTHNGVAVGSSDEAYHNNAKYYSEQLQADCEALVEEHDEDEDAHSDLFDAKADLVNGKVPVEQLPGANGTTAGTVKPVSKTAAMTRRVGIDANGNLYSEGGGDTHALSTDNGLSDADELQFYKVSQSSDKKTTWLNIKNLLASVFAALNHTHEASDITDFPTIPENLSELGNDSTHRTVTDTEKATWNGKYEKPAAGIPKSDLVQAIRNSLDKADSALQSQDLTGYIKSDVNTLANYYLKSQTYTKEEVTALISAVNQFSYISVSALPAASASTMYKIYLVPAESASEQNMKDKYITIENSGVYSWEKMGSADIDLSNYYTMAQVNALITNVNTALAGKPAVSASESGTSTSVAKYITIGNTEYKLGGSSLDDVETVTALEVISLWNGGNS